jgi:hypothetical protein
VVLIERADPGSLAVPLHDFQVMNFMFARIVRSNDELIADLSLKEAHQEATGTPLRGGGLQMSSRSGAVSGDG